MVSAEWRFGALGRSKFEGATSLHRFKLGDGRDLKKLRSNILQGPSGEFLGESWD
jgi:hypothetical protein